MYIISKLISNKSSVDILCDIRMLITLFITCFFRQCLAMTTRGSTPFFIILRKLWRILQALLSPFYFQCKKTI